MSFWGPPDPPMGEPGFPPPPGRPPLFPPIEPLPQPPPIEWQARHAFHEAAATYAPRAPTTPIPVPQGGRADPYSAPWQPTAEPAFPPPRFRDSAWESVRERRIRRGSYAPLVGVLVLAGICALAFAAADTNVADAEVGDCLAGSTTDITLSTMTVVDCDSPDGTFKVVQRAHSLVYHARESCTDPRTAYALWVGDYSDRTADVLCLSIAVH